MVVIPNKCCTLLALFYYEGNNIYIEDAKNSLAWEEHAKNNSYEYPILRWKINICQFVETSILYGIVWEASNIFIKAKSV